MLKENLRILRNLNGFGCRRDSLESPGSSTANSKVLIIVMTDHFTRKI